MDKFNKQVTAIDGEAIMFIDESFQSLRSAEGAFDMLQNFKHIRSREAINAQMMQKFKDILVQYEKEVNLLKKAIIMRYYYIDKILYHKHLYTFHVLRLIRA